MADLESSIGVVDDAREQFVDTHLVAGIVVRGGARETMHAMLARGIGRRVAQADRWNTEETLTMAPPPGR